MEKTFLSNSLLKKISNFNDFVEISSKIAFLVKISFIFRIKSTTIKFALSILIKNYYILCKKNEHFSDIFGCLSLSSEINQENVSDDELNCKIFYLFKEFYPIKIKIGLSKIFEKIFGLNSSKWMLQSKLHNFVTLSNFTHTAVKNEHDNFNCIRHLVMFYNFEKSFYLLKKTEQFSKKYRFERKITFFLLSIFFSEKFFWCFWIWIKKKPKKQLKNKQKKKNCFEFPSWRAINVREAEIEFFEQNYIYIMSHF